MLISVIYYGGYELRLMDNFVNLICIVFMPQSMDKYYTFFCGENGYCICCRYTSKKMMNHLQRAAMSRSSMYQTSSLETNSPSIDVDSPMDNKYKETVVSNSVNIVESPTSKTQSIEMPQQP